MRFEGSDLRKMYGLIWDRKLERGLSAVKRARNDIGFEPKSMDWKVAIDCALTRQTSASNTGIAKELNMGVSQSLSMDVGRFRAAEGKRDGSYLDLIQRLTESFLVPVHRGMSERKV